MQDAAKRKSLSPVSLAAVRVLLLLVVTLCLSQTRVWGFGITSQPASGVFESVTPSSTGENYDGFAYDASDSSVAARARAGIADDIPFTFRGDARAPSEIFQNGFTPRGASTDLYDYAAHNTPSIFVGTSRSSSVAADFATDYGTRAGNIFTVRPVGGIDVNKALGVRTPFPNELEIAVPGGIGPVNIRGATPLNPDGTFQGFSILNPNFRP